MFLYQLPSMRPGGELRQEVDRLFDDVCRRSPLGRPGGGFVPSVDLEESEQNYVLTADLPGMPKDAVAVEITETRVTLQGERPERPASGRTRYHCKEVGRGGFRRVVDLPRPIVPASATAKLEDGVLTLILPKLQTSTRRVVTVEIE